jgi:uncharacterized heparinase superfamily protein
MNSQQAARLLHTVAHLRPSQVAHRVRLTVRRKLWSLRPAMIDARYAERAAAIAPPRFDHAGLVAVAALRTARRDRGAATRVAEDALAGRFTLLGETRDLANGTNADGSVRVAWDRPDLMQALLWKTHLHESAWAVDLALAARVGGDRRLRDGCFALLRDWARAEPIAKPGFHRVAWNERVVATRLVHWSVAGAVLHLRDGDPDADWLGREIVRHALFLRDNLALDLLANHLFRDCFALAFADGLARCVPDALPLFENQVREQILADGCHVERCPMYHAVCTEDLLALRVLFGDTAPGWLRDALARATGFLEGSLLGDGDLALLGDGWRGEVDVAALRDDARRFETPRVPAHPEAVSGIATLARGALRLVARVGPHGPDHQLGHAHADLLSFDLSHGPTRVVTDTGTAAYAAGPVRTHLRSTAAHNTIELDGRELLEAWSSFRSGRRGRATALARGRDARFDWLAAVHDGYAWLAGAPLHHRLWLLGGDVVFVVDALRGGGGHAIASRLHLHPASDALALAAVSLAGACVEERAPLHERFGETLPMRRLVAREDAALPWVGGWALRFGDAAPPPVVSQDGDAVTMRDAALGLVVTWRVGERGERAVEIAR